MTDQFTKYLLINFPIETTNEVTFCIPEKYCNKIVYPIQLFDNNITIKTEVIQSNLIRFTLTNAYELIEDLRACITHEVLDSTFSYVENKDIDDINLIKYKCFYLKGILFKLKYLNPNVFHMIVNDARK